jgi:endonuclease/exonuclease/phosphatase family metal-dependent hydrolase
MSLRFWFVAMLGLLALGGAEAKPLRVLCYNLRYITPGDTGERAWTARRDQAAELIKTDAADIVGIQEGLPQMLNDLAERLTGYAVIGVGREDGNDKGEYSAILMNTGRFRIQGTGTFWLSDTPEIPNSRTWGNQVTRICTWAKLFDRDTKRTFHFYNTHLDHQSAEARQKGTELILSRIATRDPVGPMLLTGDLNAREGDPLHTSIKAAGFADVWRSLHPEANAEESETIHKFTGAATGVRIDYIYASPDFTPIDAAVIRSSKDGVYPSDHYPVRATLELKPSGLLLSSDRSKRGR